MFLKHPQTITTLSRPVLNRACPSLSLSVPAWPSGKGGREKPWTYSEMPISPPRSVCPEPAETPLAPRAHEPRTRLGGQLWCRAGWWRQGGFFWEGPGFRKRLCAEEVLQSDCRGGKMKDMKAHESKCSKALLMTIGCLFLSNTIQHIRGWTPSLGNPALTTSSPRWSHPFRLRRQPL